MVVDGAINGKLFLAYVEQELVQTLKEGAIVVLDNLSSHKAAGVKAAIESVGAQVVYLPPYSPDFNPIEKWGCEVEVVGTQVEDANDEGTMAKTGRTLRCVFT